MWQLSSSEAGVAPLHVCLVIPPAADSPLRDTELLTRAIACLQSDKAILRSGHDKRNVDTARLRDRYLRSKAQAAAMASTSITSSTLEPLQLHGQARPHDVQTTLNYYLDDGKPPAPAYIGKPETYERPLDARPTTIHDVRGHEHEYSVDKQGFQFYKHSSAEKDFVDDAQIKRVYYPETEQLLKDA